MRRTFLILLLLFTATTSLAQTEIETTNDTRNAELRTLDSYFPYAPPKTPHEHAIRTSQLQSHLKVALGLWPEPTRTPIRAVIHGMMDLGDYTIEKVYFESFPGLLVTGNLYKPKGIGSRRIPGVLCPHGHHRDGRFRSATEKEIDDQIAIKAEKFRANARSPLQARCVHLAKMGCVVFHYDMLGYADSQQIGIQVAHGFSRQRPAMNSSTAWGLFSPQAESHLQSVMGLQTWNSIRALDFLATVPQVDPARIGVTGASGGGTQTFILCAVDSRPAVAFPAVMVSTAMQGGCTCENCSYLRIGFGNVDFAAAFAPKPLGLTAADDWTREMSTKGFPELQQLYQVLGYPQRVQLTSRLEFQHNYNQVGREAMYRWFAKFLKLEGPIVESEIRFVPPDQLTVFDDQHPRPDAGEQFEKDLLQHWARDTRQILDTSIPVNGQSLKTYLQLVGKPLQIMIGRKPDDKRFAFKIYKKIDTETDDTGSLKRCFVMRNAAGEQFTVTIEGKEETESMVLLAHPGGSEVLAENNPGRSFVDGIIQCGYSVALIDHHFINESNLTVTRQVKNHRDFAGYTFGYNSPQIIKRLHDYLGLIFADQETFKNIRYLVSTNPDSAGLAALAAAACGEKLKGVAIDTHGFRFANVRDIRSPNLLPGGAKYFDVPGYLSQFATNYLLVIGESEESLSVVAAVRKANGRYDKLQITTANPPQVDRLVIDWLGRCK